MSTRSFGFRGPNTSELDPTEAREVKRAAAALLKGVSVRAVLKDWDERGITNTQNRTWQRATFRRMLLNPRLAGTVLDEKKWEQLVELLNAPDRRTTPDNPGAQERRYVATGGLARCSNCLQSLQGAPGRPGVRTYVCRREPGKPNCGKIRILAEPFEADLAAQALALLASPNIREQIAPTEHELAAIPERIRDVQQTLDELEADRADGVLKRPEYLRMRDRAQGRIDKLRAVQNQAANADSILAQIEAETEMTPEALAEWWVTNPVQRQHEVLGILLDHVLVFPAIPGYPGYQHGRIKPFWKTQNLT